jgi:hypothetical protein
LSDGWSLTGNHVEDPTGCDSVTAPSLVRIQPVCPSSGCLLAPGRPWYVTATVNVCPCGSPRAGVMTSSPPSRRYRALAPSTMTDPIVLPAKSRSKRDRFWVAVAVIRVVAAIRRVFGVYASEIAYDATSNPPFPAFGK